MHCAKCAFIPGVDCSNGTLVMTSSSAALMVWMSSGLNVGMMNLPIAAERVTLSRRIGQTQTREASSRPREAAQGGWSLADHSALVPENLTTLAHFSVSSAT